MIISVCIIALLLIIIMIVVTMYLKERKENKKHKENAEKYFEYNKALNKWIMLKNEKKSVAKFCINNGYRKVAIYGMNDTGCSLYSELVSAGIEVCYGIDQNVNEVYVPLDVCKLIEVESMPKVDVIIVAAFYYFDDIQQELANSISIPMCGLDDVLSDIL